MIYIMIALVLAVVFSYLGVNANGVNFLFNLLVARIIVIIIHELLHAFIFKIYGVSIELIEVCGIGYNFRLKKIKKEKFSFTGKVIPAKSFESCDNENLQAIKKAYLRSLLLTPIFTVVVFFGTYMGVFFLRSVVVFCFLL